MAYFVCSTSFKEAREKLLPSRLETGRNRNYNSFGLSVFMEVVFMPSSSFIAPKYDEERFNCPHCHAFAHQEWRRPYKFQVNDESTYARSDLSISTCQSCYKIGLWYSSKLVFPTETSAPTINQDCPAEVSSIAEEARMVFSTSPRAAAALLRLSLQVLIQTVFPGAGKNINDDIGKLVKEGAISQKIQMAMDVLRVIGNNSVHPGQMDINDDPSVAYSLFELLNVIVEDTISRPAHIESLFNGLPSSTKEAIQKRDAKSN